MNTDHARLPVARRSPAQLARLRAGPVQAAHRRDDHGHRAGRPGGHAGRGAEPGPGGGAGAGGAAARRPAPAPSTSTTRYDTDRLMARTRRRAFVTGALPHTPAWLVLIAALLAASVGAAWWALNASAALYIFLGAFFYGVVYTVWLKRRSWTNIVIGGLAGQLRGAGRRRGGRSRARRRCRCCSRWCCSCGRRRTSGAWPSPTRPTTRRPACRCCRWWWAPQRAARIVFASTVALVVASLLPGFFGAGPVYMAGRAARRRLLPAARPGAWRARRAARRRWARSSRRCCN